METVIHVTTLEQWKSVLNVWFEQGYEWNSNNENTQSGRFRNYYYEAFRDGCRQLALRDTIYFYGKNGYKGKTVEYSEFISQQKEDKEMATYYVTQEQLNCIKDLKDSPWPTNRLLVNSDDHIIDLFYTFNESKDKALLRYLGGDETIEFKVKEPLYRLWRMETNDRIYMRINDFGTPIWTVHKDNAFTAPLEEIKKHKTISWEIEEVQ